MSDFILSEEPSLRLSVFVIVLTIMALWEVLSPRRKRAYQRRDRWPGNLLLIVAGTLFLRVFFPLLAVDFAMLAEARGGGLLNLIELPGAFEFLLAIILLDMVVYWQHVAFHRIPGLWRLHQVHHTDRDLDATSALRFHPFEIGLSMVLKIFVVIVFGVSPLAVIVFEIILNATALFNHGNVQIPKKVDTALRKLIVTPDMHRVHHSVIPAEFNTNYGFNLSCWDRLFGSYKDAPEGGHRHMSIGQSAHQTHETTGLLFMLLLPFQRTRK